MEHRLRELWDKGYSGPIIARHLGIREHTVYDLARKYGLADRRRKSRFPGDTGRVDEFKSLWRDPQVSRRQLAAIFGVHPKMLRVWANRLGLRDRRKIDRMPQQPQATGPQERLAYLPTEEVIYAKAKELRKKWPQNRKPLDMVPLHYGRLA